MPGHSLDESGGVTTQEFTQHFAQVAEAEARAAAEGKHIGAATNMALMNGANNHVELCSIILGLLAARNDEWRSRSMYQRPVRV